MRAPSALARSSSAKVASGRISFWHSTVTPGPSSPSSIWPAWVSRLAPLATMIWFSAPGRPRSPRSRSPPPRPRCRCASTPASASACARTGRSRRRRPARPCAPRPPPWRPPPPGWRPCRRPPAHSPGRARSPPAVAGSRPETRGRRSRIRTRAACAPPDGTPSRADSRGTAKSRIAARRRRGTAGLDATWHASWACAPGMRACQARAASSI